MPVKFYSQKPLEVYQYVKGDDKVKEELSKFGVTFSEDGAHATGPGGNTLDIEDGDHIVLEPDGSIRRYSAQYLEQRYIEFGKAPTPTKPPVGVASTEPPKPDKRSVDEINKTVRPDEKLLDQKPKPGDIPDQKAAAATKK